MKTTILLLISILFFQNICLSQTITPEEKQQILNDFNGSDPWARSEAYDKIIQYHITEAIPIIEGKFWTNLNRLYRNIETLHYLKAPNLYTLLKAIVDSASSIEKSTKGLMTRVDVCVDAAEFLFEFGDYSAAPIVLEGIRSGKPLEANHRLLKEIILHVPQYADSAQIELRRAARENDLYITRFFSLCDLLELYGEGAYPELVNMFTNDIAPTNRYMAFIYLIERKHPQAHNIIKQQFRLEPEWVYRVDYADTLLNHYGSPSDYKFVQEYVLTIPESREKERLLSSLRDFKPPVVPDTISTDQMLQNLSILIGEVSTNGWVGNQIFINELNTYLTNAKSNLNSGNQIGSARQIINFQQLIYSEYKDSTSSTPAFVTKEGYSFLYYNARYILDRLPQIPSPFISNINPETVTAGNNNFTLTVNGTNFLNNTTVYINNNARITTYISDTVLQACILSSDVAVIDTLLVTVKNILGDSTSTESNSVKLYITPRQENVDALIDSLRARLQKSSINKWIGNQQWVNELDKHLQNAKKQYAKGEKQSPIEQLEVFCKQIKNEYESNNKNKNRWITKDVFEYLYPYAQNIIERMR